MPIGIVSVVFGARCEVLEGNDTAASLYREAGFHRTGIAPAGERRFVQLTLRLEPDGQA